MSLKCPQCGAQLDLKQSLKVASNDASKAAPNAASNGEVEGMFLDLKALEPKTNTPPNSRKRFAYSDPRFVEFWNLYPRKVGKADAYRKWVQVVREVAPQTVIDGASKYASYCASNHIEKGFIKYPEGWLNDGRWEDEESSPPAVGEVEYFNLEKHLSELQV